jgi:mannose-6-phosphate isomerase
MWYIVDAEPGAFIYIGFNRKDITREEYIAAINEGRLPELLNKVEVKPGDTFFIPAGTIHALGKGVVVLEIQQTSDVTYRVYDWERVDDNGNPRELHTALAVDAIDFASDKDKCIMRYEAKKNASTQMVKCDYFTTNIVELEGEAERELESIDSFVLYICAEGEADVCMGDSKEHLEPFDLVMIPAEADSVKLCGNAKLLEVYIE